jgi:hypothetical protein
VSRIEQLPFPYHAILRYPVSQREKTGILCRDLKLRELEQKRIAKDESPAPMKKEGENSKS